MDAIIESAYEIRELIWEALNIVKDSKARALLIEARAEALLIVKKLDGEGLDVTILYKEKQEGREL